MLGTRLLGFSLFSLGASTFRSAADLFLSELTKWVGAGASSLLTALGSVIDATTTPDFGRGFTGEFAVMLVIGVVLTLPLLLLAIIRAIVLHDGGELARAVFLRVPVAMLLAAGAVGLVELCLAASDEMSSALLAASGRPVDGLIGSLVGGMSAAGALTGPAGIGGFAAFLLALVAAIAAFLLWIELVIRSAAVAVATLFMPLALAGLVWPPTTHWARRLAETIAALILSKVVIAGTLALGGATIGSGDGLGAFVEGVALILLATMAPFALLRMMPMIEAGAVGHLEGLSRRGMRVLDQPAREAVGAVFPGFGLGPPVEAALGRGFPAARGTSVIHDSVGYHDGSPRDDPDIRDRVELIDEALGGGAR